MEKGKAALTGAGTGAAIGSVAGPIGTAAGAVIGGIGGYLLGGDDEKAPTYTPNRQNFQFGLGPSDSYASGQSARYDERQRGLDVVGADAYNRDAPVQAMPTERGFVGSQGQSFLQGADADGRRRQLEALGGLQGQVGRLNRFAEGPMGPSAAQATLRQGQGAAMAQQLAMARAQPGGGGAALRNAAFNNAGITANVANSAAQLNAQEVAQHRAQQLQALGAAQQGAGQVAGYSGQLRGQDQGFAQVQAGQANYDAGAENVYNNQQQQFEFGVGQNNQNAALTQGRQNDAMYLGTAGISQGYEGLRNDLARGNLNAGTNFESARAAGAGIGSNNFNAGVQQGNVETGMALGAVSGGLGAYNQMNPPPGGGGTTSDVRAKKDIKPVSVLEALGGRYSPDQTRSLYERQTGPQHVQSEVTGAQAARARGDFDSGLGEFGGLRSRVGLGAAGDARQDRLRQLLALGGNERYHRAQEGARPSTWGTGDLYPDMRPAQGYDYAYRDPERHGEGRFVGPMAQNLEHLPGVVQQGPDGTKQIDAPRLTLANTAAVSELQRQQDELRRRQELQALGFQGGQLPPINTTGFDTAYQGVY